jgi:hypothetical protein
LQWREVPRTVGDTDCNGEKCLEEYVCLRT